MDEREVETAKLMSGLIETRPLSQEYLDALAFWMAVFGDNFDKEVTPLKVLSYREGLKDLSVKQLNRGCFLALQNHKYASIPTIAEIREYADGRSGDPCNAEKQEPTVCEKCAPDGYKLVSRTVGSTEKCLARCDHK